MLPLTLLSSQEGKHRTPMGKPAESDTGSQAVKPRIHFELRQCRDGFVGGPWRLGLYVSTAVGDTRPGCLLEVTNRTPKQKNFVTLI